MNKTVHNRRVGRVIVGAVGIWAILQVSQLWFAARCNGCFSAGRSLAFPLPVVAIIAWLRGL